MQCYPFTKKPYHLTYRPICAPAMLAYMCGHVERPGAGMAVLVSARRRFSLLKSRSLWLAFVVVGAAGVAERGHVEGHGRAAPAAELPLCPMYARGDGVDKGHAEATRLGLAARLVRAADSGLLAAHVHEERRPLPGGTEDVRP